MQFYKKNLYFILFPGLIKTNEQVLFLRTSYLLQVFCKSRFAMFKIIFFFIFRFNQLSCVWKLLGDALSVAECLPDATASIIVPAKLLQTNSDERLRKWDLVSATFSQSQVYGSLRLACSSSESKNWIGYYT